MEYAYHDLFSHIILSDSDSTEASGFSSYSLILSLNQLYCNNEIVSR